MQKFKINILRQSFAANALVCVFILAGLRSCNAQSQSEQVTNTSPQNIKAYKTLNFGDDTKTVEQKLAEILDGADASVNYSYNISSEETFWKSLFDTDAEYEPYKFNENYMTEQSDKLQSLMRYFGKPVPGPVEVEVISGKNDAISVNCFQVKNDSPDEKEVLAIVEVSYVTFDQDKLVAGFMQNYPSAHKENKKYKSELPAFPGAFIEYEKTVYSDINPNRRATLSISVGGINYSFTELSNLSAEQKAILEKAMTEAGQTDLNEYYQSTKTMILNQVKDVKPDAPEAVFASKQILDPLMNNYRKSIEDENQKEKTKLKKESDSSTGF